MENLENKKGLELAASNLSNNNEVDNNSTTEDIIPHDSANGQDIYDPFDINSEEVEIETPINNEKLEDLEMTEWEKIYFEMNIELSDGKEYDAEVVDISESNGILNIAFRTYKDGFIKNVKSSYFFNNKECTQNSFRSIADVASRFGIIMVQKNFKDIKTIIETLKPLIGKKIVIVPKTRHDEKTGKNYQNYNIVRILGGNQ